MAVSILMPLHLKSLLRGIDSGAVSEANLYRRERLYRGPAHGAVGRGILQCPICGTQAARFLRFGLDGRRNAQCPVCGSVERHRLLWLYLVRHTDLLRRRLKVLHSAPETCLEPILRGLPNWRYQSVDRFNPAADVPADLTDLPFPDRRFDLVLTSHVLEHIRRDAAAMDELARILRPGGEAIILVPFDPNRRETEEGADIADPAERMARFGHPFHFRIYGRDLVAHLSEAGFRVRTVWSKQLLAPHPRRRFRINSNFLFHCRRE